MNEVLCRECQKEIEGVATRVITVNIVKEKSTVNEGGHYLVIHGLAETERYYHRECLPQTSRGGV